MSYPMASIQAAVGSRTARAGAATPWWLASSIQAGTCRVAYQPIGAESLAASYTNLANPGVNDAAPGPGGDPTWDSEGWILGTNKYLTTGLIPGIGTGTLIVRFSGTSTQNGVLIGQLGATSRHYLQPAAGGSRGYANGGPSAATVLGEITSGVMAVAGDKAYYNGVDEGVVVPVNGSNVTYDLYIGALNRSTIGNFTATKICAVAVYSEVLNPAQIAALTAVMAALSPDGEGPYQSPDWYVAP